MLRDNGLVEFVGFFLALIEEAVEGAGDRAFCLGEPKSHRRASAGGNAQAVVCRGFCPGSLRVYRTCVAMNYIIVDAVLGEPRTSASVVESPGIGRILREQELRIAFVCEKTAAVVRNIQFDRVSLRAELWPVLSGAPGPSIAEPDPRA